MRKRPLIITIIALCYLLSPLAIVTQASMIHHIPIFGPRNIFERLFFTDIIILGIYVLCAIGIFSVKKWGWYVFLSCSLVLIGYNIAVYRINPRYTLILLIIYNVVLAVVAGIFFRKHIIAPYFNPRLRWWETETRYKIDIYAELTVGRKRFRGEILDISNSGCLIALDHVIKLGTTHTFSLRCLSHFVDVKGRAMRKSSSDEEGDYYGIMFLKLTPLVRESLGTLLEELEIGGFRDHAREQMAVRAKTSEDRVISRITETAPRYTVQHTAVLKKEDENIHCQLMDISKHGCFVKSGHDLPQGTMYRLVLRCMKYETDVNGKIEWKSELDKQHGYGIKFMNLTRGERKNLKMIIHTLKNIGGKNRLEIARPVGEDVIDKSVTNTPYRIILFFRKLMLKDVE